MIEDEVDKYVVGWHRQVVLGDSAKGCRMVNKESA